jgi:hypothetical protein
MCLKQAREPRSLEKIGREASQTIRQPGKNICVRTDASLQRYLAARFSEAEQQWLVYSG